MTEGGADGSDVIDGGEDDDGQVDDSSELSKDSLLTPAQAYIEGWK